MNQPNWQKVPLAEGVLREPDAHRLVFWLPGPLEGGHRLWERISNVPTSDVDRERGLCAIPATGIQARQKVQGLFGKLLQGFRKGAEGQSWMLPSGGSAVQTGERQTDLLLVWSEDEAVPADEVRIKARWPQCGRLQKIGPNLFLLSGAGASVNGAAEPLPQGSPREQADYLLAAARQAGDVLRQVEALTDLAIAYLRQQEAPRAVVHLEEALGLARDLGDQALEIDVLGNLGLASMELNQFDRAIEVLAEQLVMARAVGDPYQLKVALDNFGVAYATMGEHEQSLSAYDQALVLARTVGDEEHQADLLWFTAVENAELGQRDKAASLAQAAIELFTKMGNPQVGVLRENLQNYLDNSTEVPPVESYDEPADDEAPRSVPEANMMRMALAAVKSATRFIEAGFKTVPQPTYQKRLQKCATCKHHTGVRCKLCGCFTSTKAWLPHENCPIGKWPAEK